MCQCQVKRLYKNLQIYLASQSVVRYGFLRGRGSGVAFLAAVTFFRTCERLVMVSSFFRHSAHGFTGSVDDGCFSGNPKSQFADILKCVQIKLMVSRFGSLSPRSQLEYAVIETPKKSAISDLFFVPLISVNFSPNFFFIK